MLELTDLTLAESAKLLRAREVRPSELTEAYLRRISDLDPQLNTFITVTDERARMEAATADTEIASGQYRGALHGVPIGLKDLVDTAGIRTTAGSSIHSDYVPKYDAGVARRLREKGAVLLGKLNTHEYALGTTNANPHYGDAQNPWDRARVTGGSSGGSAAATVARLAAATIGTDTGGSIRLPAALCGCVGMKATFGRVTKTGVFPVSQIYDHVGPITRTVEDNAIMLAAIAGYDADDPYSARLPVDDYTKDLRAGVRGLKIGIPGGMFATEPIAEVKDSLRAAIEVLAGLGAIIVPSGPELARDTVINAFLLTLVAEARYVHRQSLSARSEAFGQDLQRFYFSGPDAMASDLLAWREVAEGVRRAFRLALEDVDVLLTPTSPLTAIPRGATSVVVDGRKYPQASLIWLTAPMNLAGLPALTLPCGFDSAGLPIGMSITGKLFDEAMVYRVAHAFEQATEWHLRRPVDPV